jgi:hypothetical protein
MITGSFFTIGSTHLVCEDYAIHGKDYIIVSDGCSNGGGPRLHTDWGSRILCKAAEEHIELLRAKDVQAFVNRVIGTASAQVASYPNLDPRCLTATLLVAVETQNSIFVIAIGDGLIGGKNINDDWDIVDISYSNNAPYYLRYELNAVDKEKYLNEFGGIRTEEVYYGSQFENYQSNDYEASEALYCIREFPKDTFKLIFLLSDGISSFYEPINKQNKQIATLECLKLLLDFKNFQAGFVERQCQWVFKTNRIGSFNKLNWINSDDLSVGVMYCG